MKKCNILKLLLWYIGATVVMTMFYFITLISIAVIRKESNTENISNAISVVWLVLILVSWIIITIKYTNSRKSKLQKLIDTEFKSEDKYRGLYRLILNAILSKNAEHISHFNGIRAEYMSDLLSIPIIGIIFTIYIGVANNYKTLYIGFSNLLISTVKLKDTGTEVLPIDTLYAILILIIVIGAINVLLTTVNEHYFLKVYEDVKNDFANKDFEYAKLILVDDLKKGKQIQDMKNIPSTELELCEQRLKDLNDLAAMIEDDIKKFKSSPAEAMRNKVSRYEEWLKRCREIDIPEAELKLLTLKDQ